MEIAIVLFMLLFYIAIVVGLIVLFIWLCKKIAESKGLPTSYKWFGFLGVIGIIIVAVMGPSYPQYPPQNNYGQNPYQQQNGYTQQNTYFGNNPYQQQPQQQQQQPVQQAQNFCPHCGAPVDGYSVSCNYCGKMLR